MPMPRKINILTPQLAQYEQAHYRCTGAHMWMDYASKVGRKNRSFPCEMGRHFNFLIIKLSRQSLIVGILNILYPGNSPNLSHMEGGKRCKHNSIDIIKFSKEGFVETETGEHGATLYRRSPASLVVEQAADILEHLSNDELLTRIQTMREQLSEFQAKFGVDSPEDLAIDQTNQALIASESTSDETDPEVIREWKTLRQNLAFANAALSIGNGEQFIDGDRRSTDAGPGDAVEGISFITESW